MKEIKEVKTNRSIAAVCLLVVGAFSAVLIIPESRELFRVTSSTHPMAMGFIKFALLATVGELIAIRLSIKKWLLPSSLIVRMLIWGFLGAVIAAMLKLYSGGVAALLEEGVMPGKGNVFVEALSTSVIMNLTFAPVMMAFHKMTDKYLDLRHELEGFVGLEMTVNRVDWQNYFHFIVLKTIPNFWIPAHTVTFLLPTEYRTIMAAFLSIVLGIILSIKTVKFSIKKSIIN